MTSNMQKKSLFQNIGHIHDDTTINLPTNKSTQYFPSMISFILLNFQSFLGMLAMGCGRIDVAPINNNLNGCSQTLY